jgi:DMSO/TMAO reductase YedYZ molybdopterin-dependent catalytic subunit
MRLPAIPIQRAGVAATLGLVSLLVATVALSCAQPVCAQSAGSASTVALRIGGNVTTPLALSLADLKSMPRQTVNVVNPHSKKAESYQGVALEYLLHKAGVPQGEALRGKAMATYVLATASDGYRVVFSLAELDAGFMDSDVIVADTLDGAPLRPNEGPLKLVAPHDKRPARWIRMVKSLDVMEAGNAPQ